MRRCTMMAHLRLMTLSLMVMPACRRASRRPSNAARSCARRGPARNVLFCLQTLKNGILTHPSFWEDYCFLEFAQHYNAIVVPCTPYSPEQKGKVESGVKYLQQNFVNGRLFTD